MEHALVVIANISEGLAVCFGLLAAVVVAYWLLQHIKQRLGGPAE